MDRRIRLVVTSAVMGGIFIAALDTTIVAAAMPRIVADLGGTGLYSWPFAIYMVASTATVPIYGRLADSSGRKGLYLLAIGLFLLGSILCGVAANMPMLIGARLIQGLGAGGLLPLALTVAGDLYSPQSRARVLSLFSSVWALASVLGPLAGGGIVDHLGWRWIFLLNVPVGAASGYLLHRFHVDVRPEGSPGRPDFAGAVTFTVALGALLVGLLGLGESSLAVAAGGFACAIVLGVVLVRMERGAEYPLVDTQLLRLRMVAASNAVGFLSAGLLFAVAVYVPLWVHDVMGGSATESGFALTPMSIGWLVGAAAVGRVLPRTGYRAATLAGLVALVAAGASLAGLDLEASRWRILVTMAVAGLGLGFAFTSTLVAVQNAVDRRRLGQATSSVHFFRSVGGVFGVSIAGCLHLASLRAAGAAPDDVPPGILASALGLVFATSLAFAAAALVAGFFVPRGGPPAAGGEADPA